MVASKNNKFNWSRRVSRDQVRRLYEHNAEGTCDEALLDEVGYEFYVRCSDIFQIQQARDGIVTCRECGVKIVRRHQAVTGNGHQDEVLTCPRCGWEVTWDEYCDSCADSEMSSTSSTTDIFSDFADCWPRAQTTAEKLQLIDWLIHEFHVNQRLDDRPVGENVISGTRQQIIDLIAELAYDADSESDPENAQIWRNRLDAPIRHLR